MPLDTEHVDEICQDIKEQYENGVSNCALFCFKLVPEGDPLIPKAEQQCEKFDIFRKKLESMGLTCGILVQCTMGHGYPLNVLPNLTRLKNLTDGKENYSFCPADPKFREYLRHSFSVLASHNPAHIMLDDDFRLIRRGGKGCACDLHLDAFEKKTGIRKTQQELYKISLSETEENKKLLDAFIETQLESLVECAKYMRAGIDSVDPTIPGSFCCVGPCAESATEIATIMAGKGNPVIIRINNGRYHPQGPKELSRSFLYAAVQMAVLKGQGHVDSFLAETDTCPQNRYSTGAMSLHSHFTGSILEGASGCKHWITRLCCYEPASGKKYREVLGKYSKFYNTLSNIYPDLKWQGIRIPLSQKPEYSFTGDATVSGWLLCVLERFGLPVYLSKNSSQVTFLDDTMDSLYDDTAILDMLSNTLVLDGGAAERLCKRGFAEYLGVEVSKWDGKNISGEIYLNENITTTIKQTNAREIKVLNNDVLVDSVSYHIPDGCTKEKLFPASTVYKNSLGGTVIVFSGDAATSFHYTSAFGFLNETRKKQFIRLLTQYGNLPVYTPDDDEIYLKVADMSDGNTFCSLINISTDPVENIRLVCKKTPSSIDFLDCDGKFKSCEFKLENNEIFLQKSADILTPIILKLNH